MGHGRSIARRLAAAAAIFAALLVAGGCVYDPGPYYVERRTSYPSGDPAPVEEAMMRDSALQGVVVEDVHALNRFGPPDLALRVRGTYEETLAVVDVCRRPDELVVTCGISGRAPGVDEIRRWTDCAERLCARLNVEVPSIGPWTPHDDVDPPTLGDKLWMSAIVLGGPVVVAAAICAIVHFVARKR